MHDTEIPLSVFECGKKQPDIQIDKYANTQIHKHELECSIVHKYEVWATINIYKYTNPQIHKS